MMEAAYWWGIKPPYPAAPVPSRVRERESERASERTADGRTDGDERDVPNVCSPVAQSAG